MGKFTVGNGQYIIYANSSEEARKVIKQELQRVDEIKGKIANLLSKNGIALQNFMENTSEENLNIHFNDESSLIYDDLENATTKGEVRQRNLENGKFTYDLAYRYPEIDGHNADFRLAHEMGHLVLNPSNEKRQTYDKETDSRQVSGLIRRTEDGQFYGLKMQENAINLIAQLAIRGEYSADDIIAGRADISEFNLYKKADDLVKLLAVSMRNDFNKELSFEQLVEEKIDSYIEYSDGTKEPANTFFYGILNDSSMIENEFNKYMGKGAYRELDSAITQLHSPNINQERFEAIFQTAQELIMEFAKVRMQEKYKEAITRNEDNIPSLENKIKLINQIVGIEERQIEQTITKEPNVETPKRYNINKFNETIRQSREDKFISNKEQKESLTLRQRIAQLLQKNNVLMKAHFVESFVNKQLNVLQTANVVQVDTQSFKAKREAFINWITNNGEYRNLPPIQRMSDPERLEAMRRKMEQEHLNDVRERE